jgi:hypothetical protein
MTNFQIKNTRIEDGKLIVFYEFSNGEINTNRFEPTSNIMDIMKWGEDRAKWFDERDIELKELEEQVQAEIISEPVIE